MLAQEVAERIRTILLHPEPRVTRDQAAGLLGCTRKQIDTAIRDGDLEVSGACNAPVIDLRELAAYALHEWPVHVIEAALGRDASLVLPPALRTRKLTLRLPVCHLQMLNILAAEGHQSLDMFLELMIEELAGNHKERLADLVPGIEEAYWWPREVPPPHIS
jgi:hypothetical protein